MKINPLGFREYDARWLYPEDIDLKGVENLGIRFWNSNYKKNKK